MATARSNKHRWTAGQRKRIALLWSQNASVAAINQDLGMDLLQTTQMIKRMRREGLLPRRYGCAEARRKAARQYVLEPRAFDPEKEAVMLEQVAAFGGFIRSKPVKVRGQIVTVWTDPNGDLHPLYRAKVFGQPQQGAAA